MSTVILKVDLDCVRCYQKISKTLCKLKEREDIQTVTFDAKNNTVTISGQFNPHCLCKKLCCKAYNVIKDIQIKDNKEKEKEKPKDNKPAEPVQVKPKDTVPAESKQDHKPTEPAPLAEPKKDNPKTNVKPAESTEPKKDEPKGNNPAAEPNKDEKKDEQQKNKPKEAPAEANPTGTEKDKAKSLVMNSVEPGLFWIEPIHVNQEPNSCYQPIWANPGYGGNYSWVPPHSQWAVVYGTPAYSGYKNNCQYFSEENTESCIVM